MHNIDQNGLGNGRALLAERYHTVPARLSIMITIQWAAESIEQSRSIDRELQRRIEHEGTAGRATASLFPEFSGVFYNY